MTDYYKVERMRIILNGRMVGNGYEAVYDNRQAFFTKKGLKKRTVLHELCHHLICERRLDLSEKAEEREANRFARCLLKN